MKCKLNVLILAVVVAVASVAPAQADPINIVMVPVGDAGNTADSAAHSGTSSGGGAVAYNYSIGKYDVTNNQYLAFLNATATSSDPYGLWNSSMQSGGTGGINRTGTGSGPYTYTVKSGQGNQPVVYVTWYDAIRFVNWLTNGQSNGSTESGTYAISGSGPNWTVNVPSAAQRAAWAAAGTGSLHYLLPSEDEWYKAAYYKGGSTNAGYWDYPFRSNTAPTSQAPPGGSNSANFHDIITGYALTGLPDWDGSTDLLTDVGAYGSSIAPYGTLDQGGDVQQWIEADYDGRGLFHNVRGVGFEVPISFPGENPMASSFQQPEHGGGDQQLGFRVADVGVPEPGSITLLVAGAIAGLICWRRRK